MKLIMTRELCAISLVTPFMGVWIEILEVVLNGNSQNVTPFMGVWIEIRKMVSYILHNWSHSLHGSVD